jgi:hypothetical protein
MSGRSGEREEFGPSRAATRFTIGIIAALLYGVVFACSLPLSGGPLQAAGWSLLTFAVLPLFNRKVRAATIDWLQNRSGGAQRERARAARRRMEFEQFVRYGTAANPLTPPRASPAAGSAPAPAVGVAPPPAPPPTLVVPAPLAAQPTTPQAASPIPPPPPPPAAFAPPPLPAARRPARNLAPFDRLATLTDLARSLARVLPAGCALRVDAKEAVIWNSVATQRCPLGDLAPPPGGPHDNGELLLEASRRTLGLASDFVRRHGMSRWPPSDTGAVAIAFLTDRALYGWYEAGGRPVLVLDEVPFAPLPARGSIAPR